MELEKLKLEENNRREQQRERKGERDGIREVEIGQRI